MSTPTLPRAGAACGAVFSIALFVAAGDGSSYAPARAAIAAAAIVLFLPFLAALHERLGAADGGRTWPATTAVIAGVAGITLKLASGVPEIAEHRAHVAAGTQLHTTLDALGAATTMLSCFPLALLCLVVALLALRAGALPRWLGVGAGVTALALVANGAVLTTDAAPALVLFILWTLAASVALYPRSALLAQASRARA